MKKSILLFLSFLVSLFLCIPVLADDSGYIRENSQYMDSLTEANLEEEAATIAEKHDFQVYYISLDSNIEDLQGYASDLYQSLAGNKDGVLLLVNEDRSKWYVHYGGQAESLLNLQDREFLYKSFIKENQASDSIQSYLATVKSRFEKPALLVDNGGLLYDDEKEELLAKLTEISKRQGLDLVILTEDSLNGQTAQEYADNYFDFNSYGQGKAHDGVLLLVSMTERDWYISTTGYGIYAITDGGVEYISNQFVKYLSAGDYALAFNTYADLVDQFVSQAKTDKPYDRGNMPKEPLSLLWLPASALLGLFVAWAITALLKGQLQSVQNESGAENYMKKDSFKLTNSQDLFLYRNVTSVPIPKNNNSSGFRGGGGSSSHGSFSGGSHGGGGGKF